MNVKHIGRLYMIILLSIFISGVFSLDFQGIGIVVEKEGAVEIKPFNQEEFITCSEFQDIFTGDTIRTSENGRAKILFSDEETFFVIGRNSEMVIDEFIYDPETAGHSSRVSTSRGTSRMLIREGSSSESVIQTPTAVVGVKGTHLITEVLSEDHSRVTTVAGLVEVSNPQFDPEDIIVLSQQMYSDVLRGMRPTEPRVRSLHDIQNLLRETTVTPPPAASETITPPAAVFATVPQEIPVTDTIMEEIVVPPPLDEPEEPEPPWPYPR